MKHTDLFTDFSGLLKNTLLTCVIFAVIVSAAGCATSPSSREASGQLFWPPPPETPRIKWLTAWSSRYDFSRPNQMLSILMGEEILETLRRPQAVVADTSGNVYVADSEGHSIFVFDIEKSVLRFLGEGIVSTPVGLAIDNKHGFLFVSDSKSDKVFGIDKNSGRLVMTLGGPGEFKNPSGMVYDDARERLYLADTKNNVIRVFDKDGKALFTVGKQRGQGDGEFNFPSYLALDRQGRLFVVDSFNFRVQIFDPNGNYIKKFGRLGDSSGQFSRPAGIGVDSEDHVYVVDTAFNNFQIFSEDGKLLLWVGQGGKKSGEFALPTGMYIDKEDRIYICDTFSRRVQVFQYLKEKK